MRKVFLNEVSYYVNEKIKITDFDSSLYISTDSMLKDKAGICLPQSIPVEGNVTKYQADDVLVSNIRPYFKKIWISDRCGGCSNDVLVFRAKDSIVPQFLYYVLSDDRFFDHMMAGANGTKMPRGNKKLISMYQFALPSKMTQHRIADILSRYDKLISNYQKQIILLEEAAKRLYKEWFVDFKYPGCQNNQIDSCQHIGWKKTTIGNIANVSAGGDRPDSFSKEKSSECKIPVYSNGTENEGLYGFTTCAKVFLDSVTVSARGTIGYICLRKNPYYPIVRLLTITPKVKNISAEFIYLCLSSIRIDSNGAAQQQVTVPQFSNKEIVLPPEELQIQFNTIVMRFFNQVEVCKKRIYLLVEARDRLLPKLMSEEIEV